MKKNAFTLIELMAVIIVLCITISIVVVQVDRNIKDASEFGDEMQVENIESAAYLYAEDYRSNLTKLSTINVDNLTISTLIEAGLLNKKDVEGIDTSNIILIAEINGILKTKYTGISKNVIFINGPKEMSLYKNDTYKEMGAYVAIPDTGLVELDSSNISHNLDTSTVGDYEVTYSYTDADNVIRKVSIID